MRYKTLCMAVAVCMMLAVMGMTGAPTAAAEDETTAEHAHHESSNASEAAPGRAMDDTTQAMSSKQVDAGPHMKLTSLRKPNAEDQARAQDIATRTRQALAKYKDYRVALNESYKIFLPQIPMKMKHFTNYRYAMEAATELNPDRPTSLLYEQNGQNYKLIGAMFTAPARLAEDELHDRVPLSVAQWHLHINMCLPPKAQRSEMFRRNPRFGLAGAIHTKQACEAEGGRFFPRVFGWMVHVYPFEKTEQEIWSVGRQMDHKH